MTYFRIKKSTLTPETKSLDSQQFLAYPIYNSSYKLSLDFYGNTTKLGFKLLKPEDGVIDSDLNFSIASSSKHFFLQKTFSWASFGMAIKGGCRIVSNNGKKLKLLFKFKKINF